VSAAATMPANRDCGLIWIKSLRGPSQTAPFDSIANRSG
jgi:hypothetical protein